ncbi:hypothetical protein ARMGADRAFT_561649 [Armillaria gallica]|uniref:Major facilitator superfamily (MFS) profile domain-containing protein n=1 Tax=Armillaria gallica TaxID=47427 RepID=A0A2H3D8B0_ARMGA|nr:hypothetical protein ARMGADRAFT_561649 [Armillaria gallica]
MLASIEFNQSTAIGLIISGTNFLFAVTLFRVERVRRRRTLLFTYPAMTFAVSLTVFSEPRYQWLPKRSCYPHRWRTHMAPITPPHGPPL